jgi:hypothetical protein
MKQISLLLIGLFLVLSVSLSHSQSQYQLVANQGSWQHKDAVLTPSQSLPPSGPYQLFLSHISTSPQVQIYFGSGVENGQLIGQANEFESGLSSLYYRYLVLGARDKAYRADWFYNDQAQIQLTDSGTIISDESVFTNNFCNFTLEPCDQALPSGNYTVNFYLDNTFVISATATINE